MILRIHGDNIIECERTLMLISRAYNIEPVHISNSLYLPKYLLINTYIKIQIELFSGHDRWGIKITDELMKYGAPLREAADAYVTIFDNKTERILFAIEYCNALPAGNNAWQRNGRAITCAEIGIPYLYFAEVGGVELDSDRNIKAPRFPNPIVPFSYLASAKSLNIICMPVYNAHPAINNKLRNKFSPVFGGESSIKLLRFLIDNKNIDNDTIQTLEEKGLMLVETLSNERKTIDTFRNNEWREFLKLKTGLEKANWIKNLKNKYIWKKKTSSKVVTTATFKHLITSVIGLNCFSIGAKDIPICLIANGSIKLFVQILLDIYKSKDIKDIANKINAKNTPLILVWLTGFKPRGDDSRPDRGLVPLARMLFGNDIDIFSIIYGPAKPSTWNTFNNNYKELAVQNGLWQSIINLSNYILIDSTTSQFGELGKINNINLHNEHNKIIISPATSNVDFSEHDVDTAIHSLFTKNKTSAVFESMCNPPGGDWSGISIYDNSVSIEYRWTSLPRVSEIQAKRPDHVIQINLNNKLIFLSIESKNNYSNLEENIGERLKSYITLLFNSHPTAERRKDYSWELYNKKQFSIGSFTVYSGAAFCYRNDAEIHNAIKVKMLDFVIAFQLSHTKSVVLHLCCNKQTAFLVEIISSCCREFGDGCIIKIH